TRGEAKVSARNSNGHYGKPTDKSLQFQKMSMTITLPADPSEAQYEDFVAAFLLAGGYFIEPRLKFRDNGVELLELDVVATPANEKYLDRILVEAKSGGWGFADF